MCSARSHARAHQGVRTCSPQPAKYCPTPTPQEIGLDPLQNQLSYLDVILVPNFNLGSILIVLIPIFLENNFKTKTTKLKNRNYSK